MPTFKRISSSASSSVDQGTEDLAASSSIAEDNRPNFNDPRKHLNENGSDGSTPKIPPSKRISSVTSSTVSRGVDGRAAPSGTGDENQPNFNEPRKHGKESRPDGITPVLRRRAGGKRKPVVVTNKLSRRRQPVFDRSSSSESSEGEYLKPSIGPERKRKADDLQGSDIENEGDGNGERNARKRDSPLLARKLVAASGAGGKMEHAGQKQKIVYDLLSSDEEDTNFEYSKTVAAARSSIRPSRKAARPNAFRESQDGWLASFHAEDFEDSSSSDEDQDDGLRFLEARDWMTSKSRGEKLDHLVTIPKDEDKVLQLIAWDEGFGYNFHEHQFEAVRFVAGLAESFPRKMNKQVGADESPISSYDSDGEDEAIREMLRLDKDGYWRRFHALRHQPELMLPGRGMILADDMGLGKTIEALAGAVLRNAIRGTKVKPTLIVTPQDGVQQQWVNSLSKAGVEPARVRVIGEKRADEKKRGRNHDKEAHKAVKNGEFIICTRYKIQGMIKELFEYSANSQANKKKSLLFGKIHPNLIKQLRHQYNVDKGKEIRGFSHRKEAKEDRLTRLVKNSLKGRNSLTTIFETVIIDEAHFLRNVLAYWGIGAALLGAQAKRTILLTGTPYNNSYRDMTALMTFIDPKHKSASVKWWEIATSKSKKNDVIKSVRDWRQTFMLRRPKDILRKLPDITRSFINVPIRPSELSIYQVYEYAFLKILNQLQEEIDDGGIDRRKQKEMLDMMMACMSCMKMSLIHPIIPGGREVTIQFSPSRKNLLKKCEQKDTCVICTSESYPSQKAEGFAVKMDSKVKEESDASSFLHLLGLNATVRSDDDNIVVDNNNKPGITNEEEEKGPIIELGPDICRAHGSDCCHFAHERCKEIFLENGGTQCPRCLDLASRTHHTSASRKIYCQGVGTTVNSSMGFTASTKIEKAIEWFQTSIPKEDKCIFLSFFKGTLDLLEGILVEEHGIECARYDGDVAPKRRQTDLERFQENQNCRVLLASVQSGGTGLNITQANHICFVDRWFNPQIHDQAESRCHRLGQKKEVKVVYLDTCFTVDVVMKHVNDIKQRNAGVLLADGFSLGNYSILNYTDTPGVVGGLLKPLPNQRSALMMENAAKGSPDAPLYSDNDSYFKSKLDEITDAKAEQKKGADKIEDTSDASSSDGSSLSILHRYTLNGCCNNSMSSSDGDSDDNSLNLKTFSSKSRSEAPKSSISSKGNSSDSGPEKVAKSGANKLKVHKSPLSKDNGSVQSSDDDSFSDILNCPSTFRFSPPSEIFKPSVSNTECINIHGLEKNECPENHGTQATGGPNHEKIDGVIELLSSDGEGDDWPDILAAKKHSLEDNTK